MIEIAESDRFGDFLCRILSWRRSVALLHGCS
jgi:hypothetical protein